MDFRWQSKIFQNHVKFVISIHLWRHICNDRLYRLIFLPMSTAKHIRITNRVRSLAPIVPGRLIQIHLRKNTNTRSDWKNRYLTAIIIMTPRLQLHKTQWLNRSMWKQSHGCKNMNICAWVKSLWLLQCFKHNVWDDIWSKPLRDYRLSSKVTV